MKKLFSLLLTVLLVASCSNGISKQDVAKINGYWQIEKVETAQGEQKDYQGNTSYDFYEIKNDKGFRAKVMPQLDGSFLTNNLKEAITVTYGQDGTFLNYKTEYDKWREKVIVINENEFVVKNAQDIEYHYKKAGPIKFD